MSRLIQWGLRRFRYVRELEEQIATVSSELSQALAGNITIRDMVIRNGGFTMELSTRMAQIIGSCFYETLQEMDAENYIIEMQLSSEDGSRMTVTVQRQEGKTPHELRKDAEAKLEAALQAIEVLKQANQNSEER